MTGKNFLRQTYTSKVSKKFQIRQSHRKRQKTEKLT
jgi:hypothetical protein